MSFLVEKAKKIALREHEALKIFMKQPSKLSTTTNNLASLPSLMTTSITGTNKTLNPLISNALQQLQSALTISSPSTQSVASLWNRLYIGGVSFDLPEEDLIPIFEEFGFITSLIMQPLEESKIRRHKGYGFVEFREAEAALLCLKRFKEEPLRIGDRPIKVERNSNWNPSQSYPTNLDAPLGNRIYFSSFHPSIDNEDIITIFQCFGTVKQFLLSVKKNFKCGFCDFEDEIAANASSLSLNNYSIAGKMVGVILNCLSNDIDPMDLKKWISIDPSIGAGVGGGAGSGAGGSSLLILKEFCKQSSEDIRMDILQECIKIGECGMLNFIKESINSEFYDVVIEFRDPLCIERAYNTFNGRYFDGRKIKAFKG